MAKKKLPIVIDNYVKSECWTQLLLSIIQTSEHAPAWIASHIGIIGLDDMSCWYGNLSKVFSYRDALDILNFEEVNIWSVSPYELIDFLHKEIDNGNYIILELKYNSTTGEDYWIHEQLIFGYDDDKRIFYGSVLSEQTGSFVEITITYDELIIIYSDSYEHFKNPCNKNDLIFWSRSNFLISRASLRKDYVPHGCEYDLIQNLVIEKDGKECSFVQYDGEMNILLEKRMFTGISCLIAAERYLRKLWDDRYFVDKDTDAEYNDLFGRLTFNLSKNFYKLYEHRNIILNSVKWFYEKTENGNTASLSCVAEYEKCCKEMERFSKMALKLCLSRDWNILSKLILSFSGYYKKEYAVVERMVYEMKDGWHDFKLSTLFS